MPLRTTLLLVLVGCLALAAPPQARNASATAAAVTPSPGKFVGTTSQSAQKTVNLTVSRRHDITQMSVLLFYRCPDGYRDFQAVTAAFTGGPPLAVIRGTFKTSERGTISQPFSGSYSDKVAGSFPSAKRATGTIALTVNRPHHGQCTSGTVSWTARRAP